MGASQEVKRLTEPGGRLSFGTDKTARSPDPEDVKRRLVALILPLARLVLPDGRLEGAEWVGRGPDGAKWGVVVKGRKAGFFQNFGVGKGGTSGLALIRDAVCGGDHVAAFTWALNFLGSDVAISGPPPPISSPRHGTGRATAEGGKSLYIAGAPFAWDGPTGLYLRGRCISPERIAGDLRALRFAERCWHSDAETHLPAILAPVIDPRTRQHIATHRTYLEPDGTGGWRKARVARPKKLLGSAMGGVIPLTRGASNKPLGQAPDNDGCLIAEGIENAATVAQFFPELRALACVSIGNLAKIALPPAITRVLLVRDRDGENFAVRASRDAALARWAAEGRSVSVWEPAEGAKDANDYWCGEIA
jgi:hypothetical protein